MLVKRSKKPTDFVLPVVINNNYRTNFYYLCENDVFKAYRQLKAIKGYVRPLYPVIYQEQVVI